MGVPIANEMKPGGETLVNLPLFGTSIRLITCPRSPVRRPRPCRLDNHNIAVTKASEELPARFGLPGASLAMLMKMGQYILGKNQPLPR